MQKGFGENLNIRVYREAAGLRQSDLAKKLNVDQTAVSNWELGKSKPLRKYQKKLARLLGCTVEDLLGSSKED